MKSQLQNLRGSGILLGDQQPFGCQLCQKGMKVVYFMGGGCNRPSHCRWYCPVSQNRKTDDIHYIDEIPIKSPQSIEDTVKIILDEIQKVDAMGMSLTGGDPLASSRKVHWASNIIYGIKSEMGSDFHIHLYTSGEIFSVDIADRLDAVGLDDLRFHPSESNFSKIDLALDHNYTVAAEVPVIPTEENHQYLLKLGEHLDSIGADFINLNEFEMCAPNQKALLSKGFRLISGSLASVAGSRDYALRFLNEFRPKTSLKLHFCSVAMKDQVQMRERYRRRAAHIQYPFETVTSDGTLEFLRIKGAIQFLQQVYDDLIGISGVPKHLLNFRPNEGIIDGPAFLGENVDFLEDIADFDLRLGIVETLPFHITELQKVVEYTPIFPKNSHHE